MKVIGVRFKSTKKIYYFNPNGFEIKKNDNVIVETARGIEFGQTVIGIRDVPEEEIVQPLQNVIRIATEQDEKTVAENIEKQKDAFEKCREKIEAHGLDMKLVDAEYTFDGTKLIFYFTSDGRVDFRELVKDLATMFRTRIELRQIAVRDETKMLGGLGACGNEICCKRFLGDFASVSIKMAKEQNLSLNPTKISGLCGRLICCLNFEKNFYDEMNEKLPAADEIVMSPKGSAQVVSTYPLKESVRVKYTNPDGSTDTAVFHLNEITRINPETKKASDSTENEALPNEDDALIALEEVSVNTESVEFAPKAVISNSETAPDNTAPDNTDNSAPKADTQQRAPKKYPKKHKKTPAENNSSPNEQANSNNHNSSPNNTNKNTHQHGNAQRQHKKHDANKHNAHAEKNASSEKPEGGSENQNKTDVKNNKPENKNNSQHRGNNNRRHGNFKKGAPGKSDAEKKSTPNEGNKPREEK